MVLIYSPPPIPAFYPLTGENFFFLDPIGLRAAAEKLGISESSLPRELQLRSGSEPHADTLTKLGFHCEVQPHAVTTELDLSQLNWTSQSRVTHEFVSDDGQHFHGIHTGGETLYVPGDDFDLHGEVKAHQYVEKAVRVPMELPDGSPIWMYVAQSQRTDTRSVDALDLVRQARRTMENFQQAEEEDFYPPHDAIYKENTDLVIPALDINFASQNDILGRPCSQRGHIKFGLSGKPTPEQLEAVSGVRLGVDEFGEFYDDDDDDDEGMKHEECFVQEASEWFAEGGNLLFWFAAPDTDMPLGLLLVDKYLSGLCNVEDSDRLAGDHCPPAHEWRPGIVFQEHGSEGSVLAQLREYFAPEYVNEILQTVERSVKTVESSVVPSESDFVIPDEYVDTARTLEKHLGSDAARTIIFEKCSSLTNTTVDDDCDLQGYELRRYLYFRERQALQVERWQRIDGLAMFEDAVPQLDPEPWEEPVFAVVGDVEGFPHSRLLPGSAPYDPEGANQYQFGFVWTDDVEPGQSTLWVLEPSGELFCTEHYPTYVRCDLGLGFVDTLKLVELWRHFQRFYERDAWKWLYQHRREEMYGMFRSLVAPYLPVKEMNSVWPAL